MKPIIISYDCIDHDPIDKWLPDDLYHVDVWVNFTIGPDSKGGDNFQVRIVTPNNLQGKDSAKYAIILNEYSLPAMRSVALSIGIQLRVFCHEFEFL